MSMPAASTSTAPQGKAAGKIGPEENVRKLFLFALPLVAGLLLLSGGAQAEPTPSPLFGDHAVLQRNKPVPVWGRAEPGETVTVSFAGVSHAVKADPQGCWRVTFEPLPASAVGREMTMTGSDGRKSVLRDVLVGEVWIASGQSNMEFPLSNAADAKREIASADFPLIREFHVTSNGSLQPLGNLEGSWSACSPASAGKFSAVGYFFARELFQKLGVPIGIVKSSLGGTPAEAWTRREALESMPELKNDIEPQIEEMKRAPDEQAAFPGLLADWEKKNGVPDTENEGFKNGWASPDLDDGDWTPTEAPFTFERAVKATSGGVFWLRKSVELPAASAGKPIRLHLGYMAEQYDTAYFNGQEIGRTGDKPPLFYTAPRVYTVPAGLVKAGRNVIALRLVRHDPKGGLWISGKSMGLPVPDPSAVDNAWKVKVERAYPRLGEEILTARPKPNRSEIKNTPSALYNGMIAPLVPYAIQGVIWYQGENNAQPEKRARDYRRLFPRMITDWREQWNQGDFPFYFVQLANNEAPNRSHVEHPWALLRESQVRTHETVPNTGMAVAIDIGSDITIHPENKQDVGKRLALWARARTYGETGLIHQSPLYQSHVIEGGKIRVKFDTGGSPLMVGGKSGLKPVSPAPEAQLKWFEIAGADGKWAWADALIEGDCVVVSSPEVPSPLQVRYAWAINPEGCNLYNSAGLPASPFQSQHRKDHPRGNP
jgi:sialate O-acetylesterase